MLTRVHKIVILLFSLFEGRTTFAQTTVSDTTYLLKEVVVSSNRLFNFSDGTKINSIDSLSRAQHLSDNLSDLLADESSVFIKSYGPGSLATSSFRGGSANHTAILWNGFNIGSPLNGQLDLSLVPVNFCDHISIQYGGNSALWGSGAVSGTIHLNNDAKFNSGTTAKINLSGGSFSNYSQQASFELSGKRFITSLKLFHTTSKNDFKYNNIYSFQDERVTQSNAELKNYGLLSENYLLIKDNQKINLFFWGQHTDRNIPPTMLQLSNKSKQADNDFRITSEWKYEKNKITSYIRAAYFNEALVYSDAIYHLADTSRSESIITEAEAKINLSHFNSVNIGINNTFVNGITSGYSGNRHQNRTAFFASYSYASKNEKLKTNISGRLEFLQNVFAPFTFSLGADYQFTKWLTGKTNIAKVYRVPTFNDLYWVPGGNQNLLPENGYSEDAGLNFHFKNKTIAFTTDVAVFNRSIKNWIIWLPGISYWKPQNIKDVWSRGIETNNTFSIKIRKAKISFSMLTSYVVSTNEQLTSGNDASKGKQLIYVPMYSGMAKVSLEYHDFILSYRHNYTGYRYTAADNTQFLNPYDLGSAYVSCKIPMKNTSANFFFQANNIWNKEYQVLLNRAMPQQNFTAGISFEFNQPNK